MSEVKAMREREKLFRKEIMEKGIRYSHCMLQKTKRNRETARQKVEEEGRRAEEVGAGSEDLVPSIPRNALEVTMRTQSSCQREWSLGWSANHFPSS